MGSSDLRPSGFYWPSPSPSWDADWHHQSQPRPRLHCCRRSPPVAAGFTIDFIDVGQGDATLITAVTGETLLVDGGRSKARIRDRLESMGIKDMVGIALTHPDADHVAGLVEVQIGRAHV